MKQTTVTLALLCVLGGSARANTFVKSVPLGAQHTRPESIAKAWGGKYYVSIQNTSDAAATDGEIVQVDLESGTVTPFVAAGTLRNPRGLAFTGEVLVVTDDDKLWKITKAGQVTPLATTFPFPPVLFNDAAPEKGGKAVFITEMGPGRNGMRDPNKLLWPTDSPQAESIQAGGRVYRITLDGKVTNVFNPSRKVIVPNGVTQTKNGHLLVLDFFHGSVVDVEPKKDVKTILATGPFRGCDGVEQGKDGTIFVTSFENGRVWRMDGNGENLVKLFDLATDQNTAARQSLADLALDEAAGLLYVPDTLHSTIVVLKTK